MSHELELAAVDAAARELAGPASEPAGFGAKHAVAHAECLNCGARLHGRFCHACGQPADDHHRSILHLAWEAVEGLTHLDGRLAHTLPALFLRPGALARDHFEGRRQRHVPPFRLFLVCLLLFMLSLEAAVGRPSSAEAGAAAARPAVSVTGVAGLAPQDRPSPPAAPSGRVAPSDDPLLFHVRKTSALGAWLLQHGRKANASQEYFKAVAFQWAHRLAVLLLPIFALLLTVCYAHRRRFYVYDHLVVSMHFLSFVFLVSAAAYALPQPVRGWAVLAASVWAPVNLFMTLRGAYGSGVAGALVKTAGLWVASLTLFLVLLVGILAVALGEM